MATTETQALIQQLFDVQQQVFSAASTLSNTDLDKRVPMGTREVLARGILYQLVTHPREHYVHLQKVLQETDAPGARPTEAQLIAGEAAESLGQLIGLFARMTDADLDRESEGHSPRSVLDHLIRSYQGYLSAVQAAGKTE